MPRPAAALCGKGDFGFPSVEGWTPAQGLLGSRDGLTLLSSLGEDVENLRLRPSSAATSGPLGGAPSPEDSAQRREGGEVSLKKNPGIDSRVQGAAEVFAVSADCYLSSTSESGLSRRRVEEPASVVGPSEAHSLESSPAPVGLGVAEKNADSRARTPAESSGVAAAFVCADVGGAASSTLKRGTGCGEEDASSESELGSDGERASLATSASRCASMVHVPWAGVKSLREYRLLRLTRQSEASLPTKDKNNEKPQTRAAPPAAGAATESLVFSDGESDFSESTQFTSASLRKAMRFRMKGIDSANPQRRSEKPPVVGDSSSRGRGSTRETSFAVLRLEALRLAADAAEDALSASSTLTQGRESAASYAGAEKEGKGSESLNGKFGDSGKASPDLRHSPLFQRLRKAPGLSLSQSFDKAFPNEAFSNAAFSSEAFSNAAEAAKAPEGRTPPHSEEAPPEGASAEEYFLRTRRAAVLAERHSSSSQQSSALECRGPWLAMEEMGFSPSPQTASPPLFAWDPPQQGLTASQLSLSQGLFPWGFPQPLQAQKRPSPWDAPPVSRPDPPGGARQAASAEIHVGLDFSFAAKSPGEEGAQVGCCAALGGNPPVAVGDFWFSDEVEEEAETPPPPQKPPSPHALSCLGGVSAAEPSALDLSVSSEWRFENEAFQTEGIAGEGAFPAEALVLPPLRVETESGFVEVSDEGDVRFSFRARSEARVFGRQPPCASLHCIGERASSSSSQSCRCDASHCCLCFSKQKNSQDACVAGGREEAAVRGASAEWFAFVVEVGGDFARVETAKDRRVLRRFHKACLSERHRQRYLYASRLVTALQRSSPLVSLIKPNVGVFRLMADLGFFAEVKNSIFSYVEVVRLEGDAAADGEVRFSLRGRKSETLALRLTDLTSFAAATTAQQLSDWWLPFPDMHLKNAASASVFSTAQREEAAAQGVLAILEKLNIPAAVFVEVWNECVKAYCLCVRLQSEAAAEAAAEERQQMHETLLRSGESVLADLLEQPRSPAGEEEGRSHAPCGSSESLSRQLLKGRRRALLRRFPVEAQETDGCLRRRTRPCVSNSLSASTPLPWAAMCKTDSTGGGLSFECFA